MNLPDKHIEIFEELIRILSLKKRPDFDSFEKTLASVELKYTPDNEKKSALIEELVNYYNRTSPDKKYYKYLLIILFAGILFTLSIFFLSKDCEQINVHSPKLRILPKNKTEDKIILNDIQSKNENKNPLKPANYQVPAQLIPQQIIKTDTIHKSVNTYDTISNKIVKTDTFTNLSLKNKTIAGYYCSLPEDFNFIFNEQSIKIHRKYDGTIEELADKIIHCNNLGTIRLTAYYTKRYIFFSSKNLASKRINEILKQLKKKHVTIKKIKQFEIVIIPVGKKNKPELYNLVTFRLKNI